MRGRVRPHPEDGRLLQYLDEALDSQEADAIRAHLDACAKCRAEAEQLQGAIADCVWYRKNILQRELPPPPAPWPDLYPHLARLDEALERPGWVERIGRAVIGGQLRTPALAAAILLIVAALFVRLRETPAVQAAQLLRRAAAAELVKPRPRRRVRIRTRDHQFVRVSGSADPEGLRPVQALFVAASYNWQEPLSARSFEVWRNQLPDKRDQVTQNSDSYSVQTSSDSSELSQATLKLRSADLQPVEERFEFRNREWVEISALVEEPGPSTSVAVAPVPSMTERGSNRPPEVVSRKGIPPALPADELKVLAALHRIGADLGDPVDVSRSGTEVVVSGSGIAPKRRQEIQEAVGFNPHVDIRWSDSAPAKAPEKRTAAQAPATGETPELQSQIAAQVGGWANFEQLGAEVFALSDPMMSRAYALRRLAEKFPGEVEAQMGPEDVAILKQLRSEHATALKQQVDQLTGVLSPVFHTLRGSDRSPVTPGSASWQFATESLFQTVRRLDRLVAVMFGASPTQLPPEQVLAQLQMSLAELHARLDLYGRVGITP